jgi:4'-phosphopantetheinyl transferase
MAEVVFQIARLDVAQPEVDRLRELLDADERGRAARFHFDIHRRRFIVRRGRLREWLGARLGVHPREIAYRYDAFGKPTVPGSSRHFSASHSGECMAVASSRRGARPPDSAVRRGVSTVC